MSSAGVCGCHRASIVGPNGSERIRDFSAMIGDLLTVKIDYDSYEFPRAAFIVLCNQKEVWNTIWSVFVGTQNNGSYRLAPTRF